MQTELSEPEITMTDKSNYRTGEIRFTDKELEILKTNIKKGIYAELHKRGMLSDMQLDELFDKNILIPQ